MDPLPGPLNCAQMRSNRPLTDPHIEPLDRVFVLVLDGHKRPRFEPNPNHLPNLLPLPLVLKIKPKSARDGTAHPVFRPRISPPDACAHRPLDPENVAGRHTFHRARPLPALNHTHLIRGACVRRVLQIERNEAPPLRNLRWWC